MKLGRPKKYSSPPIQKIVTVAPNNLPLWQKAYELAIKEGVSRSEIVNRAMKKYVEAHLSEI